ncbi:MAG TPA: TonB-dependent receptor [Polyangiaceae bacterium]|nr:TonB-dependent receptor [Polyangiaceae bacterium]
MIEVRGAASGPGTPALSRAQARELPGAFGDPLRAIDALPGVVPTVSGLPIFFIRGAPPASVGYFVDGVEVPLLFHAFLGPSVLHPGSLSGVVLQSAPADVRYGGSAGAVIVAEPAAPNPNFHGEASLRLFDAGALVEAPFDDGRGSALVSGRYSFTGLLYSALSAEDFGYWDYQLRVSERVGTHDTVGVFAFGAGDHYGGQALAGAVGGDTGFHRLDLRFVHDARALSVTTGITVGRDRSADESSSLTDRSLRARADLTAALTEGVEARIGADARLDDIVLDVAPERPNRRDLLELFPTRTDHQLGGYVGLRFRPTARLSIEPGVRTDLYTSRGSHAASVDPRLQVNARLSRRVTVEHRFGMASQKPNFVPGVPAAQVGSLERGLVHGVHLSSSVRVALPLEFSVNAGAFQSRYDNVVDPLGQAREFRLDAASLDQRQTLTSRGLELRFGRPLTRRVGGFVSYTLSWAKRQAEREESWSGYDRRHVLQGALALELWWKVRASARGLYYSGFPALEIGDGGALPSATRRAPGYVRFDFRVERPFHISRRFDLSIVAEMLNATAAKEALRYECGGRCELVTAGPIVLPSIGVEATF